MKQFEAKRQAGNGRFLKYLDRGYSSTGVLGKVDARKSEWLFIHGQLIFAKYPELQLIVYVTSKRRGLC